MDLSKPITFGSKSKSAGAKPGKGAKADAPLKTTINFARIGEKPKTNWAAAIPGILIIAALAAVFSRFGVSERFAKLAQVRAEESSLQAQLDAANAALALSDEFTEEYYHYTWSGMTTAEKDRVSRVDVADLISFIGGQGVTIHSASLSDARLSLSITAGSLEEISALIRLVEEQEIVASAAMTTARSMTEETAAGDEEVRVVESVQAQLTIYLHTLSEIAKESGT